MAVHHGAREVDGPLVALRRKPTDHGPAGVAQAQGLGHLVEGLAHGIVDRGTHDLIVAPVAHMDEHGVAARDEAGHEGRPQVGRLEEVGEQVPLEVVHR